MMGIIRSIILAIRLYILRRNQFHSQALRTFFRKEYDIDIGMYSYGCFDRWRMPGPMRIGRYCSFANTVRLAPMNHFMGAMTTYPLLYEKAFGAVDQDVGWEPLIVEDDVWIGHHAIILAGCKRIGRGAVIGAGSIVTRDVEPYSINMGSPARLVRYRFPPEVIEQVEASRWWELELPDLAKVVRTRKDMVYTPTAESVQAWIRESKR